LINEKTRLKVEYLEMNKQLKNYEEEKEHKNREQFESFEVFVESVRDISIKIDILVITIISKKLFDSSIFIDKKNLNIEN
jgi:hypothetical protein